MQLKLDDATLNDIFGAEDAEHETPERLIEYFYKNKAYESLRADLPIRLLIGHKGVGKSALLKVSELEDKRNNILTIWLTPSDVAGPLSEGAGDFNKLVGVWKNSIKDLIIERAWSALGAVEGKPIAAETVSTSKEIVKILLNAINDKMGKAFDASKALVADKFAKTQTIRVYLDDLDRGWQSKPADIRRISALLTALRDLCGSEKSIQVRLALRTDVYFLVRTSDESTDKIERNIIWLQWSNHEILLVIAKRISTYFGENVSDEVWSSMKQSGLAEKLNRVCEPRFSHVGKWENAPMRRVLLSLTRRRPRDLIKLLYGAGKQAHRNGNNIITTQDLRETFESYSNERLQDIINEFKSELPQVDQLLKLMKPTKKERTTSESYTFTKDELINKIRNIKNNVNFNFVSNMYPSEQNIANFLYKIDFITARLELSGGFIDRKFFDQNRLLQDQFFDVGYSWEIHPAYRWALQPNDVGNILDKLDLQGSPD